MRVAAARGHRRARLLRASSARAGRSSRRGRGSGRRCSSSGSATSPSRAGACSGRRSRRSVSAAPAPWAAILTAGGIGAVVGGVARDPVPARPAAGRLRPRRDAALAAAALARARRADVARSRRPPSSAALGIAVHLTLWFTVFQQRGARAGAVARQLVRHARLVRPHPARDGARRARRRLDRRQPRRSGSALVVMWASWLAILALPSVWAIRRGRRGTGRDGRLTTITPR